MHKANYPSRAPEFPLYAPPSPLHGSSPSESNTLRAKRKSKPFLLSDDVAHKPPPLNPPVTIDERILPPDLPLDSLPTLSPSKRSMPSTDPAPTREYERPSLAKQAAARDRIRSDESFPPAVQSVSQSKIQPQSIMRRSTSNKRKTVSFHTAAPTIIEPNARAPSYSVPRTALLSKEHVKPEIPIKQRPALRKARDSVKIVSSSVPRSFDTRDDSPSSTEQNSEDDSFAGRPSASQTPAALPDFTRPEALQTGTPRRPSMQNIATAASSSVPEHHASSENRNMSDFSAGSDESFIDRVSRRMSTRVVKDRNELREASKRQSKAVAEAMASQIRGVPKSAMLAYSENDIVLAESFEDDDSSRVSLRRKSRQVKSVRMPEFTPGVVPKPPPPPPFAPPPPRTKSWRQPPPPPVSPLPQ